MANLTIVGTTPRKVDGVAKVTGSAKYAADFNLPGLLYGKIKRSSHAHARIVSIDTTAAEALPGVKAVLTFRDVPAIPHAGAPAPREGGLVADQLILTGQPLFVGDGIAAVAAITEEIADEALGLINVEYEPLPTVFDPVLAMQPDAPRLHQTEQNLVMPPVHIQHGNIEQGFAEADYIIEGVYSTGRPHPAYMEPNACTCHFDGDGKLTIYSSTQCAFMVRGILSQVLDIPLHKVRVIVEHMGGGFGAKQDLYQHEFVCALLARRAGRPVKMEYTRYESFVGSKSRHPVTVNLKQGVKKDGTLTARQVKYVSNTGAYASHGPGITWVGCEDLSSLYRCGNNYWADGYSVYTNNPIAGAFRGFGGVQAFFALDTQMDEIAHRLGMDPVDFRLKNAVGEGDASPSGHLLNGDALAACLRRGAEEVDWYGRHNHPQPAEPHRKRGWGVGTEMHSSGAFPAIREQSNAVIKMNEDGTVTLLVGIADLGTGAQTAMAQIAAEVLGLPFDRIRVISGDTDVTPFDIGAYGSRTTFVGGGAVFKAAQELKRQLLELAAAKLGASAAALSIRAGRVFVDADPRQGMALAELVKGEGGQSPRTLIASATHEAEVAYSFAAHFAEVEVDTETGQIEVKQVVAVHEVGRAINPKGVEGQIEGGIQQGIGHTLTEDLVVDPRTGRALNASFVDYKMPLAMDMPRIKTIILEVSPDIGGPFGAKGVGEDPIMAIGPAIANAVHDAIGVRFTELPITPEKVLRALRQKEKMTGSK
ncbi:MAG: putative xanthine dehydrogenase molybdenum-binding subunit XdhA [Anaerolineae bacterium]|nr:putative xanthine dehydrogenase molybdenum-binding subunit XdhA [Anaerolineae bacterium]